MDEPEYPDDFSIPDSADLWRRIPPQHIVRDENLGRLRPSSAAFENHPNGSPMSVLLADIVQQTGRGPHDVLRGHPGFLLAAVTAGLARRCRQSVARDPLLEEPAHALVVGAKTDSARKRLARESVWVVAPSGASDVP